MSATDSRRVPREQVDLIIRSLYDAADRLDWDHLPANAKTQHYDAWVREPSIGGILTKYMNSESARSWIKDGPMKEYSRARVGTGRYAKFGSTVGPAPRQLAKHVLGESASVVEGSVGVKPFHCLASVGTEAPTYLVWGAAKNMRHLVWAAINYLASNPGHRASIVVIESFRNPIVRAERIRHERIAERCGITITYYKSVPQRRPDIGWPA